MWKEKAFHNKTKPILVFWISVFQKQRKMKKNEAITQMILITVLNLLIVPKYGGLIKIKIKKVTNILDSNMLFFSFVVIFFLF